MVMITAGGKEQRSGIVPDHAVEAEALGIKCGSLRGVAYVEVHVAHCRSNRHSAPLNAASRLEEPLDVQRIGGHHQLAIDSPPGATWPIGIDLDTEIIGILQVKRFADQVVRGAGARPEVSEVAEEAAQSRTIREQNGEVIEAECSPTGHSLRAPVLVQHDEWSVGALRSQACTIRI